MVQRDEAGQSEDSLAKTSPVRMAHSHETRCRAAAGTYTVRFDSVPVLKKHIRYTSVPNELGLMASERKTSEVLGRSLSTLPHPGSGFISEQFGMSEMKKK